MASDAIEVEWDEAKRVSNRVKHGIDFFGAAQVWSDTAWTRPSPYVGTPLHHHRPGGGARIGGDLDLAQWQTATDFSEGGPT